MSYETYVYVRIDGKNAQVPTCNYNASVLTVKVDSKSLEITRDGDNLVYNGIVYSAATRTTDTTKLFGTWQVVYSKLFTFEFLEDGNVNIVCLSSYDMKTKTVKFAQKDSVYSFEYAYDTYICTLADGVMTITSTDSDRYTNFKDLPATKIADPVVVETLDAFAGTWKTSDGKLSWTFDGKGNVSDEDGKSYAYTITDGKAVFKTSSYTITCTLSGDSISAYYDDGFGEDCFTKTFTKQAEETLDAFAGTWSGKPFASAVEMVLDGKGSGTFAGNAITYTVKGDSIEFTCNGCACVVTKSGDKLNFTCDDAEWMPDFTLTKQA